MTPSGNELMFVAGGLFTAMLTVPRVVAWAGRVLLACRPGELNSESRVVGLFGVTFLHSGPWLLAITGGLTTYIWSLAQPRQLHAFLAGLGLGCVMYLASIAIAYAVHHGRKPPAPLTPELLRILKRRFFVRETLIVGGLSAGLSGILVFVELGARFSWLLVAYIVFASTVFGLVMSFLLWQWEWAYLGEREYLRRHAKDKKVS